MLLYFIYPALMLPVNENILSLVFVADVSTMVLVLDVNSEMGAHVTGALYVI